MFNLAIVFVAYVGIRLIEASHRHHSPPRGKDDSSQENTTQANDTQAETSEKNQEKSAQLNTASDSLVGAKRLARGDYFYQKMSAFTFGTALLRFISPHPIFTAVNIAAYTYTMLPFYRQVESAVTDGLIKQKKIDNYLLMGIGNVLLLGSGRYVTASFGMLMTYIGDVLQYKASQSAQRSLTSSIVDNFLSDSQTCWVVKEGAELEVPLNSLRQGDILTVRAGEVIVVDGEVVEGDASVDEHVFSGESYPVEKTKGAVVYASTLLLSGQLHIQVHTSGHETTIGQIERVLEDAINTKTQSQLKSDRLANSLNMPFLALAGIGLMQSGANGAMVVLDGNTVQTLRVLVPLSAMNYQALASHHKILLKRANCIDKLKEIDTVLFDKTGTLTDGKLIVAEVVSTSKTYATSEVLRYAAIAEQRLSHPIAQAIVAHAEEQGEMCSALDNIEYQFGLGIIAQVDKKIIRVGSARFLVAEGIHLSQKLEQQQQQHLAEGYSLVFVALGRKVIGYIKLSSTLRPEVKQTIHALRQWGIKHIGIISGDVEAPTRELAEALGVDSYHAEVLPADKEAIVKEMTKAGHRIAFVGDGVNDALAMQAADLSVTLQAATALANNVAEVVLVDNNLYKLYELFELSNQFDRSLKRSLSFCAIGMSTVFVSMLFRRIDILTSMTIHFALSSAAIGTAMLPSLEVKRAKSGLPDKKKHTQSDEHNCVE